MLMHALKLEEVQNRKEVNIELELVYVGYIMMPSCMIIEKLCDILNDKIECYTLKILFDVSQMQTHTNLALFTQYFVMKQHENMKIFVDDEDINWDNKKAIVTITNAGILERNQNEDDAKVEQFANEIQHEYSNEELRYCYETTDTQQSSNSVIRGASFNKYPIVINGNVRDIEDDDFTILPHKKNSRKGRRALGNMNNHLGQVSPLWS